MSQGTRQKHNFNKRERKEKKRKGKRRNEKKRNEKKRKEKKRKEKKKRKKVQIELWWTQRHARTPIPHAPPRAPPPNLALNTGRGAARKSTQPHTPGPQEALGHGALSMAVT